MAINWEGVAQNAITVLVLFGIGYMIYLKAKGKSSKLANIFGMSGGSGKEFYNMRGGLK